METGAISYGKPRCTTCAHYRDLLDDAGVDYEWVDISAEPAEHPVHGTIDGPTIVFEPTDGDSVALRRPSDDEVARWFERFGFRERTIHHDPQEDGTGKYVLPLVGEDAFIDYVDHGEVRHITYSQVPADRRGQGLGAELSRKTLDALIDEGHMATFGCGYVGAIADRYQAWQDFIATKA